MPPLTRSGWFLVEHRVGCAGRLFRVRRLRDAERTAGWPGDDVDTCLWHRYQVEMEVRRHGADRWEWVPYRNCADEAIRLYRARFEENE